jgi:hypothetical protein
MADQLQQVLFWIVEKQGSRVHSWKRDGTGTYAERFEPFFFSRIALGRDLESKVIQRRSSGVVPVEPSLDKNVSLKIDQGEQLGMTVPAKWSIGLLDREKGNCRLTIGIWLRAALVAGLAQQLQTENLLIEHPHSRQIANIKNDLRNPDNGRGYGHRLPFPLTNHSFAIVRGL